jgi:hypothetical protein
MPKLMFSSETMGCGATIRVDSGEEIMVSVAKAGVRVRSTKGFFGSFSGAILYDEKNVYKNVQTGLSLSLSYPNQVPELEFRNPNLKAFANAIWQCKTAAEVCTVLNEAASKVPSVREAAYDVALQEAVIEAKKPRPKLLPEETPATYRIHYSDGLNADRDLVPFEIRTWAEKSNDMFSRESKPFRIARIVDRDGKTVWPPATGAWKHPDDERTLELLMSVVEENPNTSDDERFELFKKGLKADPETEEAVLWYAFARQVGQAHWDDEERFELFKKAVKDGAKEEEVLWLAFVRQFGPGY